MKLFLCIGVLFINSILVYGKCERKGTFDVKTYKIDLDVAPIDRFSEVTNDFRQEILVLFESERKRLGEKLMPIVDFIGEQLEHFFPYPFNEEIRGIARSLNTKIGDVVLFQILYDVTANRERKRWCTSILSQQENGQIIHGRNLDYDFPELLQNLVYIAKFYRNGSLVFTSAQFAGFVGIVTGHKHNAFTFSINERNTGEWWYNLLFGILDQKATPLSFLTRELMENKTTYNDAVNFMSKSDLIAPAYFIIGGVKSNEVTILTRNQSSLVDRWTLNPQSTDFDKWFLIETNYDHWTQPPANDDRRKPGIQAMNKITQANINYNTLLDVLSLNPICNNETSYSVVMSAKESDEHGFKIIVH